MNNYITKLITLTILFFILGACGIEKGAVTEKKEVVEEEKKVEINKELKLNNIMVELDNVYVEGSNMRLPFWWSHWDSNDKIHLGVLVYPIVSQNGEELEYEDNGDTLLRQTEKGVDSRVELEYTLQDDSPVEIRFKTTADDPIEESVSVDIK